MWPSVGGANSDGQNGDGTTNTRTIPGRVAGGLVFTNVSTGVQEPPPFVMDQAKHSCGITSDNRVYCWGSNVFGQIGDGTSSPDVTRRLTPVAVVGP